MLLLAGRKELWKRASNIGLDSLRTTMIGNGKMRLMALTIRLHTSTNQDSWQKFVTGLSTICFKHNASQTRVYGG